MTSTIDGMVEVDMEKRLPKVRLRNPVSRAISLLTSSLHTQKKTFKNETHQAGTKMSFHVPKQHEYDDYKSSSTMSNESDSQTEHEERKDVKIKWNPVSRAASLFSKHTLKQHQPQQQQQQQQSIDKTSTLKSLQDLTTSSTNLCSSSTGDCYSSKTTESHTSIENANVFNFLLSDYTNKNITTPEHANDMKDDDMPYIQLESQEREKVELDIRDIGLQDSNRGMVTMSKVMGDEHKELVESQRRIVELNKENSTLKERIQQLEMVAIERNVFEDQVTYLESVLESREGKGNKGDEFVSLGGDVGK